MDLDRLFNAACCLGIPLSMIAFSVYICSDNAKDKLKGVISFIILIVCLVYLFRRHISAFLSGIFS